MALFKRFIRIYRFYIAGFIFCLILPSLVLCHEDIYEIIYTIPSITILFYPIFAAMISYFDILFLADYLYYYINPSYEIVLRLKKSNNYLVNKISFCFIIILLKFLIINYFIFNNLFFLSCLIYSIEEILLFFVSVKIFKFMSLDKTIMIVLIVLLVLKQFINPIIFIL